MQFGTWLSVMQKNWLPHSSGLRIKGADSGVHAPNYTTLYHFFPYICGTPVIIYFSLFPT
jgi:hypothetical protein